MGTMYWIRVAGMIAVLGVVIWSMRQLNRGKTVVPTLSGPMSLCDTRMTWVEDLTSGVHLEEHNRHWMMTVKGSTMREIDGPEAERWFSRLCSAKLAVSKIEGDFKPVMKLGYVSGSPAEVSRAGEGEFKLSGETFRSPDLEEALRTLPNLPEAAKPGAHP